MLSVQLPSFYWEALGHLDYFFSVCAEDSLAAILFSEGGKGRVSCGRRPTEAYFDLGWLGRIARRRGGGASGSRRRYGVRSVANEEVAKMEALLVAVAMGAEV